MNFTRFAIEKNRVTTIVVVAIVFGGIAAFFQLPRAEDPSITMRTAQVLTLLPGASASRVENLVTDPLEKAVKQLPEIDYVTSISKSGVSIVLVTIKQEHSKMRPIWDRLRRKVERAGRGLPEGTQGPIVDDEFGDVFGIVIGVTGEGFSYAELKNVADEAREELLALPDAAKVEIHGDQEERVFIDCDPAKMAQLGVSPSRLIGILSARNVINPGGWIQTQNERIALEPSGNFESVEELRQTVITVPGTKGTAVLGDLARVHRGYVEPASAKMRIGGAPGLGLSVSLRDGGNITDLGEQVQRLLGRLTDVFPIGIEFKKVAFQPTVVADSVDSFVVNLLQSIGIVLVVMLIFLGLRTGVLVASLIPATILLTMLLMSAFGVGLNQVSLAALIIALGMLVDNAIVMSESIMVGMREGKQAIEAAIDSAVELRVSLLVSSLTTSAAFLPIYLAESATGEYTSPLFVVVTLSLLSSWVLALTMIPMLCVAFLKLKKDGASAGKSSGGFDSRFYRAYRTVLLLLVRRPLMTVGVAVMVFAVAMLGFRFVPFIFFPESTRGLVQVDLELPQGTPIERTEEVVAAFDALLSGEQVALDKEGAPLDAQSSGVISWAAFIGQGAPRFVGTYIPKKAAPEYAFMLVNTTSAEALPMLSEKLEQLALGGYPDLKMTARPLSYGPPVAAPLEVRLSGKNLDELFAIVDRTKAKLSKIAGTKNIDDDWGLWGKKLGVEVNEAVALRAGISNQDVAMSLKTALDGLQVTQFRKEDRIIPVTMRANAAERLDLNKLVSHPVYSSLTGVSVPLKQVADVELVQEPSLITRRDGLKTITISSQLEPGFNAIAILEELEGWLTEEQKGWGLGYGFEIGGTAESSNEANDSIGEKMPIAMFIILLLLVGQFNSLRRAAIILLTIPLALIGVVVGLITADSYFGFMTFLGVISLAGIVINNAIVLLDRIKHEINCNGLKPQRAVMEAAQRRLRPILLTTATTMGGLLPLWYGGGPMWEPMAIAIIFGLAFSTVLTLGIVPALYSLMFRVRFADFVY